MLNEAKIQQVMGKVCWRAWDGLLPAIFFELGEKRNDKKGEFSVCVDTCPWQILENEDVVLNSKATKAEIDALLPKFVGQNLLDITFNYEEYTSLIRFTHLSIKTYLNSEQDAWYLLTYDGNTEIISRETLKKI